VKGSLRTRAAGRRQVNLIAAQKREHSRKPTQLYKIIEACSPGPYLELFAREQRPSTSWWQSGDEIETYVHKPKVFPGYNGNGRAIGDDQLALIQHGTAEMYSKDS
jgi:N6-adenosine-specific RNA methylase IME4